MKLSLEQFLAFVTSAEQGSFSAAARKLGKVQSVISTLVANLELDLGVELFSRAGRTPKLTIEGEALLPRAKAILAQCDRFSATATSFMQGIEPNLCIAIESLAAPFYLPQALTPLDQEFPELNLEILFATASEIPDLVHSDRAQLGVMVQPLDPPEHLDFQLLGKFSYWCVAMPNHPLALQKNISYEQLGLHRQVVVSPRKCDEQSQWQIADQTWSTDNPSAAKDMVLAGVGWAMLPSSLVKPALQQKRLVRLDLDFDTGSWDSLIDLVWSTKSGRGPVSMTVEKLLLDAFRSSN